MMFSHKGYEAGDAVHEQEQPQLEVAAEAFHESRSQFSINTQHHMVCVKDEYDASLINRPPKRILFTSMQWGNEPRLPAYPLVFER